MNSMKMWVLRLFLFLSVLELRNSFSIHMFMQYVNVEILSCLDYSLDHERRIGNLRGQYWLNFVRQLQDINCFWKGTCSFIERKLQLHLKKKKKLEKVVQKVNDEIWSIEIMAPITTVPKWPNCKEMQSSDLKSWHSHFSKIIHFSFSFLATCLTIASLDATVPLTHFSKKHVLMNI